MLDFLHWSYLFRREEAYGQRHLFAAYMRRLHACVREAARRRGRPLPFDVERDWRRKGSTNPGEGVFVLRPEDVAHGENRLGLCLRQRPAELDHFITLNYALLHID